MQKQLPAAPEPPLLQPPEIEPGRRTPLRRRPWIWILLLFLIAIAGYSLWPNRNGQNTRGGPDEAASGGRGRHGGRGGGGPVPIVAVRAEKGNIGVYDTALGAVTPIHTVTVKTRVDGELMKIYYKEGDVVHKDQPLAEIDPRPFQVQLIQAQGTLAKDQATLANARVDLQRYTTLLAQDAIPEQQLATQKATVAQDEGIVKADQGQVESAKLNITYAHITAPITGLAGLRLVDAGNMVHASDPTGLVVITQIQPISVIFTLAEDQLPDVLKRWRAGQRLRTDAFDRANKNLISTGRLATIDNEIDQSTGTLKLRSDFDNENFTLFPNQFVNVRLLVEEKTGVTLLPSAAIQRNAQSTYVYLVKPDSTVTIRQVNVGATEGEKTEVTYGLKPGDVVVMTGVDKLVEGTQVAVHFEGETSEEQAPAGVGPGGHGAGRGGGGVRRGPGGRGGPGGGPMK